MANTRTISFSGMGGNFELVVNPKQVEITQDSNIKTIDLLNTGTIAVAGNRGLIKVTIETFLPSPHSPFYGNIQPLEIVQLVKKWKNSKQPVRMIISSTDINTMFLMESIKETYIEGQQDIRISWGLIEYRALNVVTVASVTGRSISPAALNSRSGQAEIPKSVTAKKGDSFWSLAVRYYGSGNQWKKLAAANGMAEDNLYVGMVVKIPK